MRLEASKENKCCVSIHPQRASHQMPCYECICGASSRKPYNVGEKIFFFLADLNSPYSKGVEIDRKFAGISL